MANHNYIVSTELSDRTYAVNCTANTARQALDMFEKWFDEHYDMDVLSLPINVIVERVNLDA